VRILAAVTRADPERQTTGNRIIDALPRDVADAVARAGDLRVLAEGEWVARRGDRVRDVIFPVSGAIAHLEEHRDGHTTTIASIGSNGASGFEALLDQPFAQFGAVASVPASVVAVDVRKLRPIHDASPGFRRLLLRYAVASIRIAAISAACARHDYLTARLARWLLELHDHAGGADLAVTHDRAARMLSVRRPGVTRAAALIAATGAIRWDRGRLHLVDAARLEASACGCYAETKAVIDEAYS